MNNGNKLKWIFRTHGNLKKIKILGAVLEINFGYFLEGHKIWKNLPLKISNFKSGMYPQRWPVAPKFSDTLTLSQPGGGGQILPTIAEVAPKFSQQLRPWSTMTSCSSKDRIFFNL